MGARRQRSTNVGSFYADHGHNRVDYRPKHGFRGKPRAPFSSFDYRRGRGHYSAFYPPVSRERGILGPKPSIRERSFQVPPPPPPPFKKSFASLFSGRFQSSPRPVIEDEGWTTVVNSKRFSKINRGVDLRPNPPTKFCYLCGDPKHLAKSCRMGDIVCFKCNSLGHKARDCPSSIRATPTLPLPASIKDHIESLSSSAIFYVSIGKPTLSEL